jgi:hypothetical protein
MESLQTVATLCTSTTIAARDPVLRVSMGKRFSYSGVPNSCTVPAVTSEVQLLEIQCVRFGEHGPVPNNLAILGGPSNALNRIVIRPFSRK